MHRTAVTSSSLASAGYDPAAQTLEVEFRSGSIYRYYGVPAEVYQRLLAAESKGRFLNAQVRDRFAYRRVLARRR